MKNEDLAVKDKLWECFGWYRIFMFGIRCCIAVSLLFCRFSFYVFLGRVLLPFNGE